MKFEELMMRKKEKFTPLIYIENNLCNLDKYADYFSRLKYKAYKNNITVVDEYTVEKIKSRKYFIVRYGIMSSFHTYRFIKSKSIITNEFIDLENESNTV